MRFLLGRRRTVGLILFGGATLTSSLEFAFGERGVFDIVLMSTLCIVAGTTFSMLGAVQRSLDAAVASREELSLRLAQQQAIARLGQLALTEVSQQELLEEACLTVAAELHADLAAVLELLPDRHALLVRAAVGWPPERIGELRIPAGPRSHSGYTLASTRPVILHDAARETRFEVSPQMIEQGITSGLSAGIGANGGAYGVICAHTYDQRNFGDHDVTFLESVANVLATALRRSAAEGAVEQARDVLEAVIEGTTDDIFVKDLDGRFIALNSRAAQTVGRPKEQLIGRTMHEVMPHEMADTMAETDRITLARGSADTFEETVTIDGETCVFLTTKGPYRAGDGTLLGTFGVARDITARKVHEQELRAARDYSDRLIETSNAIVVVLDAEANIVTFNRAAEEITGYTREEVRGHNWDLLVPRDRYPAPWAHHERLLLAHKEVERYQNPILTKAGEERIVLWQNSRLQGPDGEVVGTVSFGIDMTETVAAKGHSQQLETRLQQAEKLEALGQLAGGVAHDFNNLLVAIRGYGELARTKVANREDGVEDDIEGVLAAADRAAGLTRQLLAFGRRQVMDPAVLDLRAVVRDTDAMLQRLIGEEVLLVTTLDDRPVVVKADRGQLEQVITNLVINARDAMPGGGVVTIVVSNVDPEAGGAKPLQALLSVTDEGSGIDPATASRMFEPFFTTKGEKGTGLGLATVHGIVAQSGGQIVLDTVEGRGTTFSVCLPRCDEALSQAPASVPAAPDDGTETILLVEDDPTVRSIVSMMLEARGYEIIDAAGGEEAIATFAARDRPIELIVSDLMMHGLDGRETIDRIRRLEPATKVLYMSGYSDDAIIRGGGLTRGTGFIQKPFSGDALAGHVRRILDGVGPT
jgi:two-component system cell cycle sensor histidine kinase/response regulator CckA